MTTNYESIDEEAHAQYIADQWEIELWDEKIAVATTMKRYGGSFVAALGEALLHADYINTMKIKQTFHNYWNEYLEIWNRT